MCLRYGVLAGQGPSCLQKRESCAAVLSHVVGDISELYQIGVTKVDCLSACLLFGFRKLKYWFHWLILNKILPYILPKFRVSLMVIF